MAVPENPYMPGVGPEDLRPPEFRLLQGQSEAVQDGIAKPGQFYSAQLGEAVDKLEGVVINIQKTRTLWNEEELGAPRCSSNDSITARDGGEFAGRVCGSCPLSNGPCRPGYTLTMLKGGNPSMEDLCLIRMGTPTAMTAVQNYLTTLVAAFSRVPFNAYTVIESVQRKNKYDTFHVPIPRATTFVAAGKGELERSPGDYQALAAEFAHRYQEVAGAPDGSDSLGAPAPEPGRGRRRDAPPARRAPAPPEVKGPEGTGDPQGDLF